MKEIEHIEKLYFIGIGGIGMSALARYFRSLGKEVAGYDKTRTSLTRVLEEEGIAITYKDEIGQIPQAFKNKPTLVVYTPAVPAQNLQFGYFKNHGFLLKKRSELLGQITKAMPTLAVAGTHGKTTTTAMLAHILQKTGVKLTAFVGGLNESSQSNLIKEGDEVVVVEADEFDRSFLQLSPNIAAITSMDADHLDIYGEKAALEASFKDFAALVKKGGSLLFRKGLSLQGLSIGIEENADYEAIAVQVKNGAYYFNLKTPVELIEGFTLKMPGRHNLLNAVTALAMVCEYGSPKIGLQDALKSFKGVKRRFSYKINTEKLVLIDDYAHHPAEIAAVHQAIREMHPEKPILVVFQPHLFSRTRDFADAFAKSLSLFDELFLLDIYPAREEPLEGVTSAWLLEKVKNTKKQLVQKNQLSEKIKHAGKPVVVLMGAGDIGEEVEQIKIELEDEA